MAHNDDSLYEDYPVDSHDSETGSKKLQFMPTAIDKFKHFTKEIKKRLSKALKECVAVGTPTLSALKAAIRVSLINSNAAATEDAKLAEHFCGP